MKGITAMNHSDKEEREDAAYLAGQRSVYLMQFVEAAKNLGHEGVAPPSADGGSAAAAVIELEQARTAALALCREFSIDVPAGLHLADIIEKYIRPCFIGE